MERFLKRHEDRLKGMLSGFDRVVFRGTLRSISYTRGAETWLCSRGIRYKDFFALAEKLSGQLKTHAEALAKKRGRRWEYLESSNIDKERRVQQIIEEGAITEGLLCVLRCVEPCQSYKLRPKGEPLGLRKAQRACLHLYFYFLDRDFGLMHVRLQTWFPFMIQICVNGREWLARQMDRVGIRYEKQDNCFTHIEDLVGAQQLMDRFNKRKWLRLLSVLAQRLNPLILPGQNLSLRNYYWSIWEGEYASDVMFKDATALQSVYPALIDHAIKNFGPDDVLRFFGHTRRFTRNVDTRLKTRPEGVRIKHWVGPNSIKMYDKHGSVLRIEVTINNPRQFKVRRLTTLHGKRFMGSVSLRKGVADIPRRVQICGAAIARYLEALSVVGETCPSHRLLDAVSKPVLQAGHRFRPLHPISPQESELFRIICRGEFTLQGFRNRDVRSRLAANDQQGLTSRQLSARVTRKLALLRAHGLLYRVPKTHYYRITKNGHLIIATALKFRESDIALLAA